MYILLLRPWRFISGPRRESKSGLITLIMIRGTDARTVTDIPTGKQLPELKVNGVRGQLADCSIQPRDKLGTGGQLKISQSEICNLQSTLCSMPYAPCSLLSIDLLPALPVDQLEIAAIDENTGTLSQDKYRIIPVYGITE